MTKWFKETDSTNNQIVIEKENLPDKSVFATLFQSAGKGQRGNKWQSDYGENLLFSILFKPKSIASSDQFIISQTVTLGIVNYLKKHGIDSKIKWPNDIYVGDLKICGILIENSISGDKLSCSVVGIGLNINQKEFIGVPNPTSVALQTGQELRYDINQELDSILENIFEQYDMINTDWAEIESEYLKLLYRKNELHKYIDRTNDTEFEGKIIGIDHTACLLVEKSDGSIQKFAFKEISYVLK